MAKAKKAGKDLTPEERLEQALVPVEEQPYPVPENWCWVYSSSVFSIEYGKGLSTKQLVEKGYPVFGANGQIGFYHSYMFEDIKALMSCRGAYSGTMNLSLPKSFITNNSLVIDCKDISMSAKFIYYLFEGANKVRLVSGTAQPQVTVKAFESFPVPFPPSSEQQRIVDRIESLFAKLDEAKEKAQAVVDGFELRKSAILHKAFTGELTELWRKENGMGLENWKVKSLMEVASLQTGLMKGKCYDGDTVFLPYLRVANVQDGFLDLAEIKTIEVNVQKVERYLLRKGDVLFTEGGDFDKLGRGTVWEGEISNCLHQNHIFVVRPHKDILNPYFLSFQAGSKYGKTYFLSCSKQTTNLASINSTQLKKFPVKLPPLSEQIEIVSKISKLLKIEGQAKEAAEAVLSQIDTMKKAILARAFRGELGTNDPADVWAGERGLSL